MYPELLIENLYYSLLLSVNHKLFTLVFLGWLTLELKSGKLDYYLLSYASQALKLYLDMDYSYT